MSKKPKDPEGPLREDPESQPRGKNKRGTQGTLPGVRESVTKYKDLDEAMVGLRELREEFAEVGQAIEEKRTEIMALMHAHRIPSYVAHGLMVSIEPGEEELRIRKIKPPKDADKAA